MKLLLSLFSPLAELFPNLYMSWWVPDNGDLLAYQKAWKRRVAVVFVVWSPILLTLGRVTSTSLQLFVTLLVFSAFGLRLYFFDRSLAAGPQGQDADWVEPTKLPEVFYFIAFTTIGWILYQANLEKYWLVPLAIVMIYSGAFFMSSFRSGANRNFKVDVMGRVIFTIGFLMNLYNLAKAATLI